MAGPNLLKNMTQLLCVEAFEGEESWSPSALDGSFPGVLSSGLPCPREFPAPVCALVLPGAPITPQPAHHSGPNWEVSQLPTSSGSYFWLL